MFEFIYDILETILSLFISEFKYQNYILTFVAGSLSAFIVINAVLGGVLAAIWGERRSLGKFQQRSGPNRWGPLGTLTSVADAVKVMFKEDIVPEEADRYIFNIAPLLLVIPVFIIFSVIPFGVGLYAVDINVSALFILAITSISPFRPRRWKGKVVPSSSIINIHNLNIKKRTVSVVADNLEVKNIKSVQIKSSKTIKFKLLYDKNNSLTKKIKLEQIRKIKN